jgi:hypothetical protein
MISFLVACFCDCYRALDTSHCSKIAEKPFPKESDYGALENAYPLARSDPRIVILVALAEAMDYSLSDGRRVR